MPTADELVIELTVRVDRLERDLRRARRDFDDTTRRITRSAQGMERAVGQAFRNMAGAFGVAISAVGAAALARRFLEITDEAKALDAQLRLATRTVGNFGAAQRDVRRIAAETRSEMGATGRLYSTFMRSANELGMTQQQAARATQTVAQAFIISGSTAVEAAQSTRQLVQAFQSGVLRGDEFRSVMESAPRLSQMLADSLGQPTGALIALAEQGELTSDKLVTAFTDRRFTAALDEEFRTMPVTFGQAMTQLSNAAGIAFAAFDQGGEFSNALINFALGGAESMVSIERRAEEMGIGVRSTLAGLHDAFAPLVDGANLSFEGIGAGFQRMMHDMLQSIDQAANSAQSFASEFYRFLDPNLGDWYDRNYRRPSNMLGRYQAGEARSRRDLEATAIDRASERAFGGRDAINRWIQDPQNFDMFGERINPAARRPRPATRPSGGSSGRRRSSSASRQQPVTAAEVDAILRNDLGVRVFSGMRTEERNRQVGGAPNSYHLQRNGGLARDIPIATMPRGLTRERIREAFAARGIDLVELLGPGDRGHSDHFHVAPRRTRRAGGGEGGDSGTAEARRAVEEERRNDERYQDRIAQINDDLLDARAALMTSARMIADLELQQIENARRRANEQAAADVVEGQLTQERANEIVRLNDELAGLRRQAIERRERERLAEERLAATQATITNETDLLDAQADLAVTRRERLGIELRLLDAAERQERAELEAVVASETATEAQKAIAQRRLEILGQLYGARASAIRRNNEGPNEEFLRGLRQERSNLDDRFQEISIEGLQSLNDGLVEAIMQTRSLGDVFSAVANQIIADLLRIAIRQAILGPLMSLIGGGGGGASIGGLGDIVDAGKFFGSLFGGFRATGGPVSAGRAYVVGEKRPELFIPGQSGSIVPQVPSARTGVTAPRAQMLVLAPQQFDLRGAVTTPDLMREMDRRSREHARQAGVAAYRQSMRDAPTAVGKVRRYGT